MWTSIPSSIPETIADYVKWEGDTRAFGNCAGLEMVEWWGLEERLSQLSVSLFSLFSLFLFVFWVWGFGINEAEIIMYVKFWRTGEKKGEIKKYQNLNLPQQKKPNAKDWRGAPV